MICVFPLFVICQTLYNSFGAPDINSLADSLLYGSRCFVAAFLHTRQTQCISRIDRLVDILPDMERPEISMPDEDISHTILPLLRYHKPQVLILKLEAPLSLLALRLPISLTTTKVMPVPSSTLTASLLAPSPGYSLSFPKLTITLSNITPYFRVPVVVCQLSVLWYCIPCTFMFVLGHCGM